MSSKNKRKKHNQKNDRDDENNNTNITDEEDGEEIIQGEENAEQSSETVAAEDVIEPEGLAATAEALPEDSAQEENLEKDKEIEIKTEVEVEVEENKTHELIEKEIEDTENIEESASETSTPSETPETPDIITENVTDSLNEPTPEEKKSVSESKGLNVFKTAFVLGAITLVAALMLSVVNGITAPVIQERALREKAEAVEHLFGNDITIEKYMGELYSPVVEILLVSDKSGESFIGYCVSAQPKGYGGKIEMLIALNAAKKITGIDILEISETIGIGSQVDDNSFLSQFIDKSGNIDIKNIDTISGATISSKAVLNGINKALESIKDVGD